MDLSLPLHDFYKFILACFDDAMLAYEDAIKSDKIWKSAYRLDMENIHIVCQLLLRYYDYSEMSIYYSHTLKKKLLAINDDLLVNTNHTLETLFGLPKKSLTIHNTSMTSTDKQINLQLSLSEYELLGIYIAKFNKIFTNHKLVNI